MKAEIVHSLTADFESQVKYTDERVEFWLARELQLLLGYSKWSNFVGAIDKARAACENAGNLVSNHFADVGKTIAMPKGASKEVQISCSPVTRIT